MRKTLTLKNDMTFPVQYRIYLSSGNYANSIDRLHTKETDYIQAPAADTSLVSISMDHDTGLPVVGREGIGPSSFSGIPVFSCSPMGSVIAAGTSSELTVTFNPDRTCLNFADRLYVSIAAEVEDQVVDLSGRGWERLIYVLGGEERDIPEADDVLCVTSRKVEAARTKAAAAVAAAATPGESEPDDPGAGEAEDIFLTFEYSLSKGLAVEKDLVIGMLKAEGMKASVTRGDYTFECISDTGFTIDQPKNSVDVGVQKVVKISFEPPKGANAVLGAQFLSDVPLLTKVDVQIQYMVRLVAIIVA